MRCQILAHAWGRHLVPIERSFQWVPCIWQDLEGLPAQWLALLPPFTNRSSCQIPGTIHQSRGCRLGFFQVGIWCSSFPQRWKLIGQWSIIDDYAYIAISLDLSPSQLHGIALRGGISWISLWWFSKQLCSQTIMFPYHFVYGMWCCRHVCQHHIATETASASNGLRECRTMMCFPPQTIA